jgi:hypothetical protein
MSLVPPSARNVHYNMPEIRIIDFFLMFNTWKNWIVDQKEIKLATYISRGLHFVILHSPKSNLKKMCTFLYNWCQTKL